jgi:hypothetical protein
MTGRRQTMSEYALYEIVEVERLREELVKTKRLFTGCAKEIDRLAGRLEQEEEMRVAAESLCEELEQQLRESEAREAVLRGAIFEAMGIGLLMDDYNTTCKHCLKEPNCTHEKGDCPLDRLNKILQAPAPDVNPCGSCACTEICKDRAEKERKLTAENRALREALELLRPVEGYITEDMPDDEAVSLVTYVGTLRHVVAILNGPPMTTCLIKDDRWQKMERVVEAAREMRLTFPCHRNWTKEEIGLDKALNELGGGGGGG